MSHPLTWGGPGLAGLREPVTIQPRPFCHRGRLGCDEKEALWGKGHIQRQWDSNSCPSRSPSPKQNMPVPDSGTREALVRRPRPAAARPAAAGGGRPGPSVGGWPAPGGPLRREGTALVVPPSPQLYPVPWLL